MYYNGLFADWPVRCREAQMLHTKAEKQKQRTQSSGCTGKQLKENGMVNRKGKRQ